MNPLDQASGPPTLLGLQLDCPEAICGFLDFRAKLRLLSCCRELWLRAAAGDLASSPAVWGDVVGVARSDPDTLRWLARRARGLRKVALRRPRYHGGVRCLLM